MKLRYTMLAAIIAFTVLPLGINIITAQEDDQPKPSESAEQQTPGPDEQEPIKGYPVRKRRIGGPTDVEWDLDNSFPKRGSVLELILRCTESQPSDIKHFLGSEVQSSKFKGSGFKRFDFLFFSYIVW